MNQLRVGVVGCGRMGALRADAATRHGATVVTAFDPRVEVAEALAARFPDCRAVPELEFVGLDALFICSPPAARGNVERQAVLRGIPVFMEKPIGLSAAHVWPIQEAVRSSQTITAVGYMNRYRESVLSARRELEGRAVLGATSFWVGGPYQVPWWVDPVQSGGPVNEQATHVVDLARFLLGDVARVQAVEATDARSHAGRSVAVMLEFMGGAVASIFYSCGASDKRIGFEVFTSEGSILLSGWDLQRTDPVSNEPLSRAPGDRYQIFEDETAAFLRAVAQGADEEILCNLEDALRTQAVVDAILRAIRTQTAQQVTQYA
jgi:myo-inositol 2-dehydrogenase / D-chiro-inositol 1-dehydrogenase